MAEEPAKPSPSAGKSPRYWRRRRTPPTLRTGQEPFGAGLTSADPPMPDQPAESLTESESETQTRTPFVHPAGERAASPEGTGLSAPPADDLLPDEQHQPQPEVQTCRTVDTDTGRDQKTDAADAVAEPEDASDGSDRTAPGAGPTDDASESPVEPSLPQPPTRDHWDNRATSRDLAIELKRIESRIRELLEGVDPRRKRRLEGTRRWHELQEDVMAMRFTRAIDERGVGEILALCAKRHRLFQRLNFLVATRPTWNT